jgi:hypothetical protein
LKPAAPFSTIFFNQQTNGVSNLAARKKTGLRHKMAQIGTNQPIFLCRGRREAHLPPFHCLLLQLAASTHLHRRARDCHPIGKVRSGGCLTMGHCRGAYAVDCCPAHSHRHYYHLIDCWMLMPHCQWTGFHPVWYTVLPECAFFYFKVLYHKGRAHIACKANKITIIECTLKI